MARISISQINANMLAQAGEQEASSGSSKVWNSDYPIFPTPINRKVLIYVPKDFDQRKVECLIHDTHKGKAFGQARCINGLSAGFEAFGYTGECPFCQVTADAWELYNFKLDQKAAELGIDRQNDTDNLLKGTKENLLKEMAVKNADKYICFPIVVLPSTNAGELDPTSKEGAKAYFVLWRKSRFDEKFSSDTLDGRESIAGTFQRWSFTYDTKGQQPTAMLSAKALQVKILEKPEILAQLNPYIEGCEQLAAPFTALQAVDNVKALNFYSYEDTQKEAEACIKPTRAILAAAQSLGGGAQAPAINGVAAPAIGTSAGNAADVIANFGQTAPAGGVPMGNVGVVAPAQGVAMGAVGAVAPAQNVAAPTGGVTTAGLDQLLGGAPATPQFGA